MHTSDLYRELNLLKVPLIHNVQIACIVFKHVLNSLPPVFKNYFTCSNEIHTHATRNTTKLHVRQPLNENGKKMIKYFGAHIWNMLPESVITSPSLPSFKKNLKRHYLNLQNSQ